MLGDGADGVRGFVEREVADAPEYLHPGVGNRVLPELGVLHGDQLILVAPDDQRRNTDAMQIALEFGVPGLLPKQARDRRRLAIARGHEFGIGAARQPRFQHLEIRDEHADDLVAGQRQHIGRRMLLAAHARRRDQRQAFDPMRLLRRELRRQIAAKR